jgi:hypothetical protein
VKISIEIDVTAERAQKAVGMMREVKKFYEETADARMRQGKLTLVQAAERLEPIADALLIVGVVELAVTEASEPGLDEVAEFEAFTGVAVKGVCKNVAAENEAACGDCRVPRCRFCDQPGTRAGGRKDGAGRIVERYYVCETDGCIAAKMRTPQPAKLFAGGDL